MKRIKKEKQAFKSHKEIRLFLGTIATTIDIYKILLSSGEKIKISLVCVSSRADVGEQ